MSRLRLNGRVGALAFALVLRVASSAGLGASDGITETMGELLREGEKLTLTADVEGGEAPFVYQWYKNGAPMAEGVGASLKFEAVGLGDSGSYAVLVYNASGSVASLPFFLTVTPAKPSRLANISVIASTEERVVVGFVIGGSETQGTSRVLVRAAGPALGQFGVLGGMQDPVLNIKADGKLLAANDNWEGSKLVADTGALVGAYPFLLTSQDAAVVLDLPPSVYVAEVANSATMGQATMIEVYDTNPGMTAAVPRLLSISARGIAGSGAARLIAGFTIEGEAALKVLVRAVGPSLTGIRTGGALQNPRLTLARGVTLVAANERWGSEDSAAVSAATSAVRAEPLPAESRDSALVVTLKPGSYTAQVTAAQTGVGLALIEVYEVP